MIIEFKASNFCSIKDEVTLSLESPTTNRYAFSTNHRLKQNLLPAAGLFGPNASGKSTILNAIHTLGTLVNVAESLDDGLGNNITPFLLNKKYRSKPSNLEISFLYKSNIYNYGLSLTKDRVFEEWLYMTPSDGRKNEVFKRTYNNKTDAYIWEINEKLVKGPKSAWKQATSSQMLFLSVSNMLNAGMTVNAFKEVEEWFNNILQPAIKRSDFSHINTAKLFYEKTTASKKILAYMRDVGLDLHDIKVIKRDEKVWQHLSKDMPDRFLDQIKYATIISHLDENDEEVFWELENESDGTKTLFALLGPIMVALEKGQILIIDELHTHLHSTLMSSIISLFQNPAYNRKQAQLIFTSHDVFQMDSDVLSKEQIWLTEKSKTKSTKIRNLSDIRGLRNDSKYYKHYMLGKFDALPSTQFSLFTTLTNDLFSNLDNEK